MASIDAIASWDVRVFAQGRGSGGGIGVLTTWFSVFLLTGWGLGGNFGGGYTTLDERRVTIYLDRVEPAYGGRLGRMGRGLRVEEQRKIGREGENTKGEKVAAPRFGPEFRHTPVSVLPEPTFPSAVCGF